MKSEVSIMAGLIISVPVCSSALAAQVPSGCREPFETAGLIEAVIQRWDAWTVEELRAYWPNAFESLDTPPTQDHLPTHFAHYAQDGACGESFGFTAATLGNPQFLEQIELRFMSRDLEEAELAGKQFLSSFGRPFQLLSEGYDEWTLDKDGYLHREYRWDDPEIRVAIDLQRHEGRFLLSVSYDRATKLDTAPPARPDDPLKLHVSLGETKLLAPSRMHCVGEQVEPDELSAARELARRIERELAKSPEWIRIVPAEEADYVVLLGAHWEEREREGARRCVSADVELPGQHLGRAIIEGGPNWRELENMDTAAAALARGIAELFQEQYYRLLNQRPRDR